MRDVLGMVGETGGLSGFNNQSFDNEIGELNMEQKEDPDAEDLAELGHKQEKKDLFFYALSV